MFFSNFVHSQKTLISIKVLALKMFVKAKLLRKHYIKWNSAYQFVSKTKLFYKILWKINLTSTNKQKNNEKYIVVVLSVSCDDRIWFFRLQSYSWYDFYFTTAGLLQCSLNCCGCFHENFQISHLWQAWKRENKIIFEVISSQSGREKNISIFRVRLQSWCYPVQKKSA